jgi:PEP-CTERM motif
MRKLLLGALGAGALAVSSVASAEIEIQPPPATTVDTTGPTTHDSGFHFSFGYSDSGSSSPFDEMVSFTNSLSGYYGFTLTSVASVVEGGAIDPATDVDFCATCVFVTGMTAGGTDIGTLFLTPGIGSTDANENYALLGQFLDAGAYTLHIQGTRGVAGSFGGNVSFAVANGVPEPATWAMMLLGFGGIGWQLRRRRSTVLAQAA